MASPLANAIEFLQKFGLFDIILPFLLVFTLVFAILEKTKILGVEDTEKKTPKKNLNSMVAFVTALLVVATNKVVTTINAALPNIILLLVVSFAFLLLLSIFHKTGELEFNEKHRGWYAFFVIALFIGVVLVFLGSLPLDNGGTWLSFGWSYVLENWEGSIVSSFIFLGIVLLAIFFVTYSSKKTEGG
ncbi:hypothetical protein HYT51_01640 [Candidatus Woesearchaeota archaeon]|nr:hypothetical protein [Candidatus Woesearchaeota archaeon]